MNNRRVGPLSKKQSYVGFLISIQENVNVRPVSVSMPKHVQRNKDFAESKVTRILTRVPFYGDFQAQIVEGRAAIGSLL